jgi:hypothetical protein
MAPREKMVSSVLEAVARAIVLPAQRECGGFTAMLCSEEILDVEHGGDGVGGERAPSGGAEGPRGGGLASGVVAAEMWHAEAAGAHAALVHRRDVT